MASRTIRCWFALYMWHYSNIEIDKFMVQTIFTPWAGFHTIHKDVLPNVQQSNLIYKFQCCCNATYIRCTSQHLEVRIKQHGPRDIHKHTTSGDSKLFDSAICDNLNALNSWVVNYSDRARTKQHLIVQEAIYILCNKPSLCKQNPKHSLNL